MSLGRKIAGPGHQAGNTTMAINKNHASRQSITGREALAYAIITIEQMKELLHAWSRGDSEHARRRRPLLQSRKKPQRMWRSRLYIRELRESRGITLAELAKAIAKSAGLLSQIENGHCGASPETLEDIAEYFGLRNVGQLFEPPASNGHWRHIDGNNESVFPVYVERNGAKAVQPD
jgi:DNA-binding XRE family transcriptional regulator